MNIIVFILLLSSICCLRYGSFSEAKKTTKNPGICGNSKTLTYPTYISTKQNVSVSDPTCKKIVNKFGLWLQCQTGFKYECFGATTTTATQLATTTIPIGTTTRTTTTIESNYQCYNTTTTTAEPTTTTTAPATTTTASTTTTTASTITTTAPATTTTAPATTTTASTTAPTTTTTAPTTTTAAPTTTTTAPTTTTTSPTATTTVPTTTTTAPTTTTTASTTTTTTTTAPSTTSTAPTTTSTAPTTTTTAPTTTTTTPTTTTTESTTTTTTPTTTTTESTTTTTAISGCMYDNRTVSIGFTDDVTTVDQPNCYKLQCQSNGQMEPKKPSNSCPSDYTTNGSTCYSAYAVQDTFCWSRMFCQTFDSEMWTSSYLDSLDNFKTFTSISEAWIGIYGNATTGRLTWLNGTDATDKYNSMSYTTDSDPSDKRSQCVVGADGAGWTLRSCNESSFVVCERFL